MSLPELVGVYGGGRMGAGIAHTFAVAGSNVVVVDVDDAAVDAAGKRITESLKMAAERGKLADPLAEVIGRVVTTADPTQLADCKLVIEAVPESATLKNDVLQRVETTAPGAVLATNTSSLSVDELAAGLQRPDRFLGLHFFNPVPPSALVEIVVGERTDPTVVERARTWVDALDKTAITVSDAPGFASSRLGVMLALEAMRMLEEGVASAEDIDAAMTLGYRHPVGPLRTTDIVGLDVRLAIAEHLHRELGDRFAPPSVLSQKVEAGHLGRKTGRGFYQWPDAAL